MKRENIMRPGRLGALACAMALAGYAQTAAAWDDPGRPGDPDSWRTPEFKAAWGVGGMHAEDAYAQGANGSSVKVGILDSGYDSAHPEFDPQRFHALTASGRDANGEPFSVSGVVNSNNDTHGTLVSGTIGANRDGVGMHGVAYASHVYVANTNQNDSFLFGPNPDPNYFTAAYDALQAAGVRVINNSWGSQPPDVSYATLPDLQAAWAQHYGKTTWLDEASKVSREGVVNVFSAGNSGYANASVRAALPYFRPELEGHWMAVSGMRENGTQIYNQCGVAKYWCVAAPTLVTSTKLNGGYGSFNGTSAAAPHATGALALVMDRFPWMTSEQALTVLFTTAEQAPGEMSEAPSARIGWGLPNLKNAMGGPGQLLGEFDASLPAGVTDTWQHNISDTALQQRQQEDKAEHDAWLQTLQSRGWQEGVPADASIEERSLYATGAAREAAYQQRQYRGSLVKSGAGTLILTGESTYTGPTTVSGGLLAVNGSIASDVSVQSGGTLGGSGRVGSLTANRGATVAPGNSIGTLRVDREARFESGSDYRVEVAPGGRSDRIEAGQAVLGGGTVSVSLENGANLLSQREAESLLGEKYTILTTRDGVSGRFDGVNPSYPFISPTLNYASRDVGLAIARTGTAFDAVALTANEKSVARAVESLGARSGGATAAAEAEVAQPGSGATATAAEVGERAAPRTAPRTGHPVFESVLASRSPGEARRAFRQLSGQIHADVASALVNDSRYLRETLNGRLRQAEGLSGPSEIKADEGGAWAQLLGAWDHASGTSNASGYQSNTYGVLLGADTAVASDWRIGLATGYSRTSLDGGRGAKGDSDNYHLAAYGGREFGALSLRTGAAYTWHRIGTSRDIRYGAQRDRASSSYGARTGQLFAETGYGVSTEWLNLEPFASLAYVNFENNRIGEHGGAAALGGGKQHTDATLSTLGLRADKTWQAAKETAVTLRGEAGWQHQYGERDRGTGLHFRGSEASFVTQSVPVSRDGLLLKAGAEVAVSDSAALTLGYGGLLSSNHQDNSVNAGFNWRF